MKKITKIVYFSMVALFSALPFYPARSDDVKMEEKVSVHHKTKLERMIAEDPRCGDAIAKLDYLALDLTYMMTAQVEERYYCSIKDGMKKIDSVADGESREETYKVGNKYLKNTLRCFNAFHTEEIDTYDRNGRLIQKIEMLHSNSDFTIKESRIVIR